MRLLAFAVGMDEQGPRRLRVIVMTVFVCRCFGLMIEPGQVDLIFGLRLMFLFDLGGYVGRGFEERRVEPY